MLTVKDAAAELDGKSRKYFLGAYNNINFPVENKKQHLFEYLELIRDDPVFWLQSLPASWKGISALTRARAAVTSLLSCEKVVADHKGILQEVKKAFRRLLTSKVIYDEIARRKDNESAEDYDSDSGDSSDSVCLELEDYGTVDEDPALWREESGCLDKPVPSYKDNLKQFCIEYATQTNQDGVRTLLTCLWNGRDDHSVDALVQVLKSLAANDPKVLEVFNLLHGPPCPPPQSNRSC